MPVRFRIARNTMHFSHHLFLTLNAGGYSGFGAAPLYDRMALKTMWSLRVEILPLLKTLTASSFDELRETVNKLLAGKYNSVLYAVDSALWDAQGKKKNSSVCELLHKEVHSEVPITQQIFIDSWEAVRKELKSILKRGVRALKVKVGADAVADVELVGRIRQMVGDNFQIKLDANEGYNLDQAMQVGKTFKRFGVVLWEDPIYVSSWNDLHTLRKSIKLPVMLDASIKSIMDLNTAIQYEALDILNLKLTRIGGITQALRYIDICHRHGVGVSIGCSEDLGPAMASILHLSAGLDPLVGTEGIGWERLGFDCAEPRAELTDNGTVILSDVRGFGINPDWKGLEVAGRNHGFGIWDVNKIGFGFLWENGSNILSQRFRQWLSVHRN